MNSLTDFVKRRRSGLTVLASAAGGAYLLTKYAKERFADLSERLVADRTAKETLRRRFQQNQEDCAFTLLALLPELSRQVFAHVDVEAVTAELSKRAEQAKQAAQASAVTSASTTLSQHALELSTVSLPNGDSLHAECTPDAITSTSEQAPPEQLPVKSYAEAVKDPESAEQAVHPEETHVARSDPPADHRSKAELWQAVKTLTFQRSIAAIYLLCLLTLHTHIQLNLIGRRKYVSAVHEQADAETGSSHGSVESLLMGKSSSEDGLSHEHSHLPEHAHADSIAERQYLTFTWWYLHRGWRQVCDRIEAATHNIVGPLSVKTQLNSQDLSKALADIRREVDYEPDGSIYSFARSLLPSNVQEEAETLQQSGLMMFEDDDAVVSPRLRILLDETRDYLDSPDTALVLRACLDRTFALVSERLGHLFSDGSVASSNARFTEIPDKKVRLAAILPALARISHSALNEVPNEYAEALATNRELQEFSAVVYSNFAVEA